LNLRDYINKNPIVTAGVTGVVIVVVVIMIIWQRAGGSFGSVEAALPKRFFTTDDGKSYFPDTIDKIPPFNTSDNKTAYGAQVIRCGKGEPFVAYVEKYTDEQKKKLEGMFSDPKLRSVALESTMGGQLPSTVKNAKTGDTGWVDPKSVAQYEAIVQRKCPDGGTPQPVYPPK
jgi:hypothetical protein